MVRSLIILACACAVSGCYTPLTPIQAGSSTAVMIEDLTEDPEQDAQEQSLLEGMDDVLSGPMNMLKAGLAADLAFFWSLGDLFSGNDVNYKKRYATMSEYVPVTLSSPSTPPRQLLPSEMPGSPFAMKK